MLSRFIVSSACMYAEGDEISIAQSHRTSRTDSHLLVYCLLLRCCCPSGTAKARISISMCMKVQDHSYLQLPVRHLASVEGTGKQHSC